MPPADRTPTTKAELISELTRRIRALAAVFDLASLSEAGRDPADITSYYEQSRLGYKAIHSAGGAIHMALNPDGKFSPDGYNAPPRLVAALLAPSDHVLELACGNGFNLRWLASRYPEIPFTGIDLMDLHVCQALKNTAGLANAHPTRGSFQEIPFADNSFELLFVIESLCYATDMELALRETCRVTAPGGKLLVVDGWRNPEFASLAPVVRRAATLVEKSMAVGMPSRLDIWHKEARAGGWRIETEVDHTASIMPNLLRFAGLAERYLGHPHLVRLSLHLLPKRLLMNAVAAYLMPLCVQTGAYTYRAITLTKPEEA